MTMEPRVKTLYCVKTAPYMLVATLLLSAIIIEAQRAPHKVNGIVGGTVLLSVMVPRNLHVVEVRWRFGSAGPAKARLGDSKRREFVPFNLSYTNYSQLIQRLDMYNENTLRIRNLAMSDSGKYTADVQFNDGNINEEEFQLNIYDPVPVPHIEMEWSVITTEFCNVTLMCQSTLGSDVHFNWFMRNPANLNQYIFISSGQILHLQSYTHLPYSEYLCVVTNPADQKNASITWQCPKGAVPKKHMFGYVLISILLIKIPMVICAFILWKKTKTKEHKDDHWKVRYAAGHETEEAVNVNSIRGALSGSD